MVLVGTLGVVSAVTVYEKEVYDKIDNPWTKLKYGIAHGFFLFTSWGEQNDCSTFPDWDGWIKGSATWSSLTSSVSCSKVNSNKCAIDIWYDNTIYLSNSGGPPSNVNWNNWLREVHGEDVSFSSNSHPYYFIQVYSCPDTAEPPSDHETDVYVCESGEWDFKGDKGIDQSCSYDTSGENRCWCSDEDDNFYVDESGGVHCQPSSYSSVTNGAWCSSEITVHRLSNNQCTEIIINANDKTSNDYDTLSECRANLEDLSDELIGEIIIDGSIEVIAPALFSDYLTTIKVPLKNFGGKSETINLEGGFYSPDYACNTAKLYPCSGTIGSIFPFFSSVPVPNVNPAEEFVKTKQVTLEPGETEIVELKVNRLAAFATYPEGITNIKTEPLVWFAGLYKTPLGGYTNEAGDVGKGIMFDYGQYSPSTLLGGCDNVLGWETSNILCGSEVIGSCNGDILTLEKSCDITLTLDVVNGTPATAIPTSTTLSNAKKISLDKDTISKSTSADLLASACLSSSECVLLPEDEEDYDGRCISLAKLRDEGTLTDIDTSSFFENAGKIGTGVAIGAGAGITACVVVGATISIVTGGAALPITAPLVAGCGIAGGLLGGSATKIILDITQDDDLLKELNAENTNAVGICTKEAKGNLEWAEFAAWFDVDGNGIKDGVDGIIIIAVMVLFGVLILRK